MTTFKGIPLDECGPFDVIYTFVDNNKQATHINVTILARVIKRTGVLPMLAMMGDTLIEAIERGDLNQEEDHAETLPDEALDVPCIVGEWGTDHIIIDGSHRLWRRYKRGDRDFPAYNIPEAAWRHFVIEGMPGSGEFWDFFNKNVLVR